MVKLLAVAGVLLFTAAACSEAEVVDTPDLLDASYGVEATGCSLVPRYGSATSAASGLVFTSAHTVAGATAMTVEAIDGRAMPAELVAIDIDLDLAVLAIEQRDEQRVLDLGEASAGDNGWLLKWEPGAGSSAVPIEVNRRILVTVEDIYIDALVERRAIEFTGDVVPGDSGGAIVGDDGRLLGIVYAASRERAVGFALRPIELVEVLDRVAADPVDPGPCVP